MGIFACKKIMYLFILIILIILALSIQKGQLQFVRSFDVKLINVCQLLLALSIVMAHLSQYLKASWLKPFTTCGGWAVPIFFFISGYGLYYSLKHKRNYLQGFIYKRLGKILVPFILSSTLYVLLWWINDANLHDYIFAWRNIKPFILPYSWFVLSIIVFYLLFYVAYNMTANHKTAFILTFIGVFAYESYRLSLGSNPNTFCAGFCFPLGILSAQYEDKITYFFQRQNRQTVYFFIALFAFASVFLYNSFGKIYCALTFYLLIRLVPQNVKLLLLAKKYIQKMHFNKISYEIYLTQGIAFLALRNKYLYIDSSLFYVLACIATVIIISGGYFKPLSL